MTDFVLAPIVEGHGDVAAVRVLLRQLQPQLRVATPVRQPRAKLVTRAGLTHAVHIAASNITATRGAVMLLIDADNDCPATLARLLQRWLTEDFSHIATHVVLAKREIEAWVVGGDASYGVNHPDEAGKLERRIQEAMGRYKKSVDLARLMAAIDPQRLLHNSRSFRRLEKVAKAIAAQAEELV